MKAGAELCRRTTNVFKGINHMICVLTCTIRPRIRQLAFSQPVRPYGQRWIQLWHGRRQILYPETRIEAAEDSKGFSGVIC